MWVKTTTKSLSKQIYIGKYLHKLEDFLHLTQLALNTEEKELLIGPRQN